MTPYAIFWKVLEFGAIQEPQFSLATSWITFCASR